MTTTTSLHRNVTVDHSSGSSLDFSFQPAECEDLGWSTAASSSSSQGSSYRNCTVGESSSVPSARLNFTGVAVYYLSPYIMNESIQLSVDGLPMDEIDLSPLTKSSNSSSSDVYWKRVDLTDGEHVLDVRPAAGSRSLNLGSVIITQLVTNGTSTSGTSGDTANVTSNPSLVDPTVGGAAAPTDKFAIGFGSAFAGITLLILLAIAFVLGRRRREWRSMYGRRTPVPPIHSLRTHGQGTTAPGLETHGSEMGLGQHYYPPPSVYVTTMEDDKIGEATPPRSPVRSVAHREFTATFDFDGERGLRERDLRDRQGGYRAPSSTTTSPNLPPPSQSEVPAYVRSVVSRDTMSTMSMNTNTTMHTKLEPVRRPTPQY